MKRFNNILEKLLADKQFGMPKYVGVEGNVSTMNLPVKSMLFKDYLQSLEFPAFDEEILEVSFTLISTAMAKAVDKQTTFAPKFTVVNTTELELKLDGKVFPTTGFFLGNDLNNLFV